MNTLEKWAQDTIDLITPYAEKLDKDFYPLQSSAFSKDNFKVLFLGLNPGGGSTYTCQKANVKWEFVNDKMTVERLLKGNPCFEETGKDWKLIKGIKRISCLKKVLENDNFLLANYYYISTSNFNEVESDSHQKEAVALCKQQTLELIKIVNPELIIVLGTSTGVDQLPFNDSKIILRGFNQRLIVSAKFDGKPVYAIPHPSTMAITYEEAAAINQNFLEIFNNQVLTKFTFIPVDYDEFSIELLNDKLEKDNIKLKFNKLKENEFVATLPSNSDELLLKIVTKKNEKYFCIRDAKAGNKGSNERFYANLDNQDKLVECVSEPKHLKVNSWLIQKSFKMYGANSLENFYSLLVQDIKNLFQQ